MDDSRLIKNRILELERKSFNGGYFLFTDFFGLAELALFNEAKSDFKGAGYTLFGGAQGTERVMIRFGKEEELGYSEPFPISVIKIEPISMKFSEKLTHRDFLGALLNLGIERRLLGDIPIVNNTAYLFAKSEIADFIISSLTRVKHTDVKLSVADGIPEGELYKTERRIIQLSGERVDAVIAKAFSLSREEALGYFKKRLVFIDGRLCENNSYTPKSGEVISCRTLGRLIYRGYESNTRKGKLNIAIDIYV